MIEIYTEKNSFLDDIRNEIAPGEEYMDNGYGIFSISSVIEIANSYRKNKRDFSEFFKEIYGKEPDMTDEYMDYYTELYENGQEMTIFRDDYSEDIYVYEP